MLDYLRRFYVRMGLSSPYIWRELRKTIVFGSIVLFLVIIWTMQILSTVPVCADRTRTHPMNLDSEHGACKCPNSLPAKTEQKKSPKVPVSSHGWKRHINYHTSDLSNQNDIQRHSFQDTQSVEENSFKKTLFMQLSKLVTILDEILPRVENEMLKVGLLKVRQKLDEVAKGLNSNSTETLSNKEKMGTLQGNGATEVCPEIFKGTLYGYPFYEFGFLTKPCPEAKMLNQMVTIVFNWVESSTTTCNSNIKLLNSVSEHCPNCHIIIGVSIASAPSVKMHRSATFTIKEFSTSLLPGSVWNELVSLASTPYVFIGRDLDFITNDTKLERLLREIKLLDARLIGGSIRNDDGHWIMGCEQIIYRNNTLKLVSGYHFSHHECVTCHYIHGPFLARRDHLRKYKFDEHLSNPAVFYDYFLKHITHNQKVALCPDNMSNMKQNPDNRLNKTIFLPLAQKWKINHFDVIEGAMSFSCEELHIDCSFITGMAVPPCCLQLLSKQIKFIMKQCQQNGIICELQEGTLLGAVKMNKVLPWERDGDITFLSSNFSALLNLQEIFAHNGYTLIKGDATRCCVEGRLAGGTFEVKRGSKWTPWTIQLYGQHRMDSEWLLSQGLRPTQVYFDGIWVNVPRNPGQHVRNRYGYEVYRHAQHWISLGKYSGWELYDTSGFTQCVVPGRNDCLDQFRADGNIQFKTDHS